MNDQIHFGDTLYISIKTVEGALNLLTCDSFYSKYVWAGPAHNINQKNYLSCLFQIHSIKEIDSSEEKKAPHDSTDLKKEPLRAEEQFALKHIQSGLFLEVKPQDHQGDSDLKDLRLTSKLSSNGYFVIKGAAAGDTVKYGSSVNVCDPKYNLFLTHSSKEFAETDETRKFDMKSNKLLNTAVFAKHPFRKQEAQLENESKFLVGFANETGNTVIFDKYDAKSNHVLKTGEHFRLNNDGLYLTIYWHHENGAERKLFYQSTEWANYPYIQIYTVFSFVPIVQNKEELPKQEELSIFDPAMFGEGSCLPDGLPVTKYLLRHYVSGYYLAIDPEKNLVLIPESELVNQNYWSEVIAVSKERTSNNTLLQNHGFGIGFTNGSDVSFMTFSDEPVTISNVQLEKNTTYYMGFNIPDEYLNKKIRPQRKKIGFTKYIENGPVNFLAELVDPTEMRGILRAESLTNQICLFTDFFSDLKTPLGRKEHEYFKLNAQIEKQYEKDAAAAENQEKKLESAKGGGICIWEKLEKDTLLWLNRKMKELADVISQHLHRGKEAEGSIDMHEESKEQHHDAADSGAELSQVELWAAREFRVLDLLYMMLHYMIRDPYFANEVKKLNEKYKEDPEFTRLDNNSLVSLLNSGLELILVLIKKDHLNHFYGGQFTRINIHCLSVWKEGLLSGLTHEEKRRTNELILEAACASLWDEDLDALGQLNFYYDNILKAIKEEEDYQALFIRLLEHQSRSKAPNLANKIQESFITNVITLQEEREHMFPQFDDAEGGLVVKFIRYKNREQGPQKYKLLDLVNAGKTKLGKEVDPETRKKSELLEYLISSLKLLNGMAQSDELLLYQIFIQHYPIKLLEKAVEQTVDKCFELNIILRQIISNVHLRYLNLPLKQFPSEIALAGEPVFRKSLIEDTAKTVSEGMKTLVSDLETDVLKGKQMLDEIESYKALLKTQLSQNLRNGKLISTAKVQAFDPLEVIKGIQYIFEMSSKGSLSLDELLEIRLFLCKTLEKAASSKEHSAPEIIREALTTLEQAETQINCFAAENIVEEIGNQSIDTTALEAIINQKTKDWKTREKAYSTKEDTMIQVSSHKYPASSLAKLLLELNLRKDEKITLETLKSLQHLTEYEKGLFNELKKTVIVADKDDGKKISELIKIVFKLNEYIRLYRCKESNKIEITAERQAEIFNDIHLKINQILFTIYDARKHFRYFDSDKNPEEVFLENYDRWKEARWDKCLKVNPAAVSKLFQRIFLILNVPKILFNIIEIAISIKEDRYTDVEKPFLTVIRKAAFILTAFISNNKQSQDYLSNKKFVIQNFYKQIFINQTVDVMLIFSEMLRDNKQLKRLPIKYLYDITWYTYFGTLGRKVTGTETNSYLCTTIMALHYLYELRIGKDTPALVREKIEQVLFVLSKSDLKEFDLATKWSVAKENNENADSIQSFEVPYSYLSTKEFFHSWDEISHQIMGNDWEYINIMGDYMSYKHWDKVFENPWMYHQFELRNLFTKFISRSWYPKQKTDFLENQGNLNRLMFRLLADLNEYIKFHAEQLEVKKLEAYKPIYHWLLTDEIMVPHTQAYEKFYTQQMYKAKVFIYAEDISLHSLWHEYIYEGLIELLNTLLLRESSRMVFAADIENKEFPNLLFFYLHYMEKLSWIPNKLKDKAFVEVYNTLNKAASMSDYQTYRSDILKLAELLAENCSSIKKQSSDVKGVVGMELYEHHVDSLLRRNGEFKEANIRAIADTLGTMENSKEMLAQVIASLRNNFTNMKKSEVMFTLKLLRHVIERENTSAKASEPIYTWETIDEFPLKRIKNLQSLYRENKLTDLLFKMVAKLSDEKKIFKEVLQLATAYLYDGNQDIQKEFYEKFIASEANVFLKVLREMIDSYAEKASYLDNQTTGGEPTSTANEKSDKTDALKENRSLLMMVSFFIQLTQNYSPSVEKYLRKEHTLMKTGDLVDYKPIIKYLNALNKALNNTAANDGEVQSVLGVASLLPQPNV